MKKILIVTEKPFSPKATAQMVEIARVAGYQTVLLEKSAVKDNLAKEIASADAVIVRSDIIDHALIETAPQLKVIVRAGAGVDNIDLTCATEKGVVVMNTPGQNANAVAELVIGMMIYQARGGFSGKTGSELRGNNLGLHGFGFVARAVSRIALGLGMNVYAFDPHIPAAQISLEQATPVQTPEDLYAQCNYVSLHIPAIPSTRTSIDRHLLERMPIPATLINTAREEIIHEGDLLSQFAERSDFCYLADVAPKCKQEIQTRYPGRFFFTPQKMGAQTEEANFRSAVAAMQQICGFFESDDRRFQVNQ